MWVNPPKARPSIDAAMPLTDDQEEHFLYLVNTITSYRSQLNSWERTFLDDQIKRHDEYGAAISLSPKQWNILNNMYEKVTS